MALLNGWIGLILGFSGLIFIHELGHFVLAKWNGVRVYVFSLGMGPYLLSFSYKGTIYALSMIPIGGYVKMMGQDDLNPVQDANPNPQDYRNKRAGQKAAILAAGAGFNIMFTIAIFTFCYWYGMDMESPRIGNIGPESPLATATIKKPDGTSIPANLKPGEKILDINGVPVKRMNEVVLQVASTGKGEDVLLHIDRPPPNDIVYVQPKYDRKMGAATLNLEPYFEKEHWDLGFTVKDYVTINGDLTEKLFADKPANVAGLKKGDIITQIDGKPITEPTDAVNAIRGSKGKTLNFDVTRTDETGTHENTHIAVTPIEDKDSGNMIIGAPLEMLRKVVQVDEKSQAYAAGLRPGVYAMFAPEDDHWEGDKRVFTKGKLLWFKDPFDETEKKNPGKAELTGLKQLAEGGVVLERSSMYPYKANGIWDALSVGWTDTVRGAGSVFSVLHALLTGKMGAKALSGPVGIGRIIFQASNSQEFIRYLWILGFISLNLGVLQFVPIPLLDGWHLVEVFIEKLKGSPIAPKVQQAFQMVGLVIVGTLLLYATYQDFMR